MCWLPVDLQPNPSLPADSTCIARSRFTCSLAAQLLASRLRIIGDQLENRLTTGGSRGTPAVKVAARGRLRSLQRAALRIRALVLAVARRHL